MQILSTKLSIPPIRSRLVSRPRLIQKLEEGLGCGFILVSAPAGYGKSTLLSAWLEQLKCPSTWLSLDEKDNDPVRFTGYLYAAAQIIDPDMQLQPDPAPDMNVQVDVEALLTPLINCLAGMKQSFCLVIDDYHVIQEPQIHEAIGFILEHRPEPFRLIIATRADPPLPLARLRARCDMLELRMSDLRFTTQEAADFLGNTMGLKVSINDVSRITERTEGWIAGLQLAALSMQNAPDRSSFIEAFTGGHHYVFEYLLDEILAKQPHEILRFLLSTSILDQLTAPLCDYLLSTDGEPSMERPSSTILEELHHSNLFIIPLDHDQRYYRYHPLFAELLRGYLQKNNPSQIPLLHCRASEWFEEQGMVSEAIRHAFAADDWERSVRLISANIFALLEQNELNSVERQLQILSTEKSPARPWLLVGYAWLVAYTGQLSSVEPVLKLAETEIDNLNSEVELQTLGGHIAAIRAYANWIANRRDLAAKAAQVALQWLPEDERLIRCQASTLLGLTLNDYDARGEALIQAIAYSRECSVSHVTIFARSCWAWYLIMQGKLHQAYAACQEGVRQAQLGSTHQPLPTLSHIYSSISFILREWNQLEAAVQYSKEAVDLARRWEQADALHFALDNLGLALFASGRYDEAYNTLHQEWNIASRTSAWFEEITVMREVEWSLARGDLAAALGCLHRTHLELPKPSSISLETYKNQSLPLVFVKVFLAQKRYSDALELTNLLLNEFEARKLGGYLIRLHTWQALAYQGLGQADQALASLKSALTEAAPEDYVRFFLQEGPSLLPLLAKARDSGITPGYVNMLLSIMGQSTRDQSVQVVSSQGLVEPLSARELEVLHLLAQGCSDKQIAESLVIAPETVHKHLKNIYGKLDVHSRTSAVRRAGDLGVLKS